MWRVHRSHDGPRDDRVRGSGDGGEEVGGGTGVAGPPGGVLTVKAGSRRGQCPEWQGVSFRFQVIRLVRRPYSCRLTPTLSDPGRARPYDPSSLKSLVSGPEAHPELNLRNRLYSTRPKSDIRTDLRRSGRFLKTLKKWRRIGMKNVRIGPNDDRGGPEWERSWKRDDGSIRKIWYLD